MPEAPVSPFECALAISIPLTRGTFVSSARSRNKDFAAGLCIEWGIAPELAWSQAYAPAILPLFGHVLARARAAGATVVTHATLGDLARLCRTYRVVTLLTHFKIAPIVARDVLDPEHCLAVIRAAETPIARLLFRSFAQRWPHLLAPNSGSPCRDCCDHLATALQASIAPSHSGFACLAPAFEDRQTAAPAGLHRIAIEECLTPALRPAPCIELFDGMRQFAEFREAIPQSYDGVLDLSLCNSFMVAEQLKRARPHSLVVENSFLATPHFKLRRYSAIMLLLSHKRMRYTDALTQVHRVALSAS
jgi:hypothetical protein